MNYILNFDDGERYKKVTIYSDLVNRDADYAIIDYEKNLGHIHEDNLQKKVPSMLIRDALAEFQTQEQRKIVYGKDVEVKNVNELINERKQNKM